MDDKDKLYNEIDSLIEEYADKLNKRQNIDLQDYQILDKDRIEKLDSNSVPTHNIQSKPVEYKIEYPRIVEQPALKEKIIEKKVIYDKASGSLWRKIAAFTLISSLLSGVLGGYIADSFNKEKVVIEKEVQVSESVENRPESYVDIIENCKKSAVEINSTVSTQDIFGRKATAASAGSGVIFDSKGYVITNAHVVENADSIEVVDSNGVKHKAELVGSDTRGDIAVLKILSDETFSAVTLGDSSQIKVGQSIFVIGNPLGTLGGSVTSGIISAVDRDVAVTGGYYQTLLQTDATINSGNSGGGLFDSQGRLIGIINAKDSGFTSSGTMIEGIGFAIPINRAMDIANQLMLYGVVTDRANLGIKTIEIGEDYENLAPGLYIAEITSGSSAEKAGLQYGDRFISVNDTEIKSFNDLYKIIDNSKVGDILKVVVERENEQLEINVELLPQTLEF